MKTVTVTPSELRPLTVRERMRAAFPEHFDKIIRSATGDVGLDRPAPVYFTDGEILSSLFVWEDTPEGHDFWRELAKRRDEREKTFDTLRANDLE